MFIKLCTDKIVFESNFWKLAVFCVKIHGKDSLIIFGDFSELDSSVKTGRLLAGEGVLRVVAGQRLLVEHGLVAAEETPLGRLHHLTFVVLDREANMENLGYVNAKTQSVLQSRNGG